MIFVLRWSVPTKPNTFVLFVAISKLYSLDINFKPYNSYSSYHYMGQWVSLKRPLMNKETVLAVQRSYSWLYQVRCCGSPEVRGVSSASSVAPITMVIALLLTPNEHENCCRRQSHSPPACRHSAARPTQTLRTSPAVNDATAKLE